MRHPRRGVVKEIVFLLAVVAFAFLGFSSLSFVGKANIVLLATGFAEVNKCRFAFLAYAKDVRLLDVVKVENGGDYG